LTYKFFQPSAPSFEPNLNAPGVEGERLRNPGVDIDSDLGHSVYGVHRREVAEVLATAEGRGSRKRRRRHPTTLYECDCGEIIPGGDVERGDGLIECNKAGCETRWVSPQRSVQKNRLLLTIHSIVSYEVRAS
jgi:hypothetical protein